MTTQTIDPVKDPDIIRRPIMRRPKGGKPVQIGTRITQKTHTRYRGWTTIERMHEHLSLTPGMLTEEDERYLQLCVDATNRALAYWRPDLTPPSITLTRGPFAPVFAWGFDGGSGSPTPDDHMIVLGASMLAASWFQRRGVDIAAFAEFGGPPPAVGRDIEQMLRINRAARPVIA